MQIDFLNELNASQLQAVKHIDGASLVIAGAGSGKTRVLTYKIAYLISQGVSPASILALTFTNKAAKEMKNRIGQLAGYQLSRYLWMGTFHAIFSRILRSEAEHIGYTKNFSIYDTSDSKSLIKSIVKEMGLDEKVYKPGYVHGRISQAKNQLVTPKAYYENADYQKYDTQSRVPKLREIYAAYAARCKQADAMDFDDLLMQTNILFGNFPEILAKYQQIFAFILVDEYQDTNFAQYLIVKKLSERHERVCVVGDDAQSIYSFRGANIDNILQFQKTYKEARIFKLEQNYRSTKNIVNAANSLIDKNSEQIRKTIFSEKTDGSRIKVSGVMTDFEEGFLVASQIADLHRKERLAYGDFAILYRTNSQSRVMEEALRKQAIPYRIYGGLSFYQRKEIKDVISYLRLVVNPHDEEALKRVINVPARGIGDTTVGKVVDTAQLHQTSAWTVLGDMLKYNLPVNAGTASKLANFRDFIQSFADQTTALNAYELAAAVVKATGIISDIHDRSVENLSRIDNIQELLKAVFEYVDLKAKEGVEFVGLADFLSEVSLLTDQDNDKTDQEERVTLMTVHAAKGLEYNTVFIVGMEEELFPSPFAETPRELEEERRLFYVAITRAEERCYISYAKSRFRNGKTNFSNPSRFLKDIDSRYLDVDTESYHASPKPRRSWDDEVSVERNLFRKENLPAAPERAAFTSPRKLNKIAPAAAAQAQPVENAHLPVGCFVKHALFGIGKVLETSVIEGNEKATIDFGEKGTKSLLLKFARLEVLR